MLIGQCSPVRFQPRFIQPVITLFEIAFEKSAKHSLHAYREGKTPLPCAARTHDHQSHTSYILSFVCVCVLHVAITGNSVTFLDGRLQTFCTRVVHKDRIGGITANGTLTDRLFTTYFPSDATLSDETLSLRRRFSYSATLLDCPSMLISFFIHHFISSAGYAVCERHERPSSARDTVPTILRRTRRAKGALSVRARAYGRTCQLSWFYCILKL